MAMNRPVELPLSVQRSFQDLQRLVRAANRANLREAASVPVRTLADLSVHLMLIEPARKRRNFHFRYVGDALIASYQQDFTGMSFGDVKKEYVKRNEWPAMKKCLEAWVSCERTAAPGLLQSTARLGVWRGQDVTRLIMPIFSRGKVSMLAGALIYGENAQSVKALE